MYCTRCGVVIPRDTDRFCAQCGTPTINVLPPPAGAPRRLERSIRDRRVGGVCGGFAEYLNTDPTLIRLLFIVTTILTGFVMGLVAYLVCWVVMPQQHWWYQAHPAAAASPTT
jgi:phage shock protein C